MPSAGLHGLLHMVYALRGDVKITLLHLVTIAKDDKCRLARLCSSVTPLPHVRLKVTPGDDIQLLFPIHFNVVL